MRDFEFEHHDGDDDGDDSIAECFEAGGLHAFSLQDDEMIQNPNRTGSSSSEIPNLSWTAAVI